MQPTKKSLAQRKREHAARRLLSQPEDHAIQSGKTRGGLPQSPPPKRGLALRHAALSQTKMMASMASSVAVESPVLARAGLCTRSSPGGFGVTSGLVNSHASSVSKSLLSPPRVIDLAAHPSLELVSDKLDEDVDSGLIGEVVNQENEESESESEDDSSRMAYLDCIRRR